MSYYYGVKNEKHLVDTIKKVADVLGGGEKAIVLMIGTCATETHFGKYPDDNPESLGVGVAQCDQIALDDIQIHIRGRDQIILKKLGYDIRVVQLKDLAYDPLLACCIMRLVYKRKTEPLPIADDLMAMGHYWKDHYNSHHPNAAGTPEKFFKDWHIHAPNDF